MTAPPDLVLAGNLLVDDIVLADGTTLPGEPGGAVFHMTCRSSHSKPRSSPTACRSLARGVVSANFALEDRGSRGLARATPALAWTRLAEWFPELARRSTREPVAR